MESLAAVVAYGLMFLGLIGAVLPVVPGPMLIWLGALLWAWQDGFQAISWPTLLVLGILTVVAWSTDLLLTAWIGRRTGASWKAIGGAIAGGFLGGILFGGFVPVVGTIIAALIGGVLGVLAVEYLDKRNWQQAVAAGRGYIGGFLLSSIVEVWLAVLMIVLFLWQ
ncbi:MAG: DUF456 domain-containing protein, partial [Anaerolineae bacterium]